MSLTKGCAKDIISPVGCNSHVKRYNQYENHDKSVHQYWNRSKTRLRYYINCRFVPKLPVQSIDDGIPYNLLFILAVQWYVGKPISSVAPIGITYTVGALEQ